MSEVKQLNYTVNPTMAVNKIKKTEEVQVWVNFNDLSKEEAFALKKRGLISHKDNPTCMRYYFTKTNMDLPQPNRIFNDALNLLSSWGYQGVPSLDELKQEATLAFDDVAKPEEVSAATQSTDDMWINFMKHVNEEQVQSVLRSLGMGGARAANTYGHIYSRDNALMAIAQKPNATFVLTRKDWIKRFERDIKQGAQRIILQIPTGHGKASAKDKIDFVNGGALGSDKTYGKLSGHEKHFVDVKANTKSAHQFFGIVYYDISDTEQIDPNGPDLWGDYVGLENNLTGKLNQHALADQAKNMGKTTDDISAIYNNKIGDLEKTTLALAKFIESKYAKLDISNLNLKNERTFGILVEQLAHHLVEKVGKIVKPENRTTSVNIIKSIVFALTNLHPEIVASQLKNNILTEKEYFAVRNYINTIINGINKFLPMNENRIFVVEQFKLLSSVDELLDMIGVSHEDVKRHETEMMQNDAVIEQKNITESFNKFYKRLTDNKLWN